MNLQKLNIRKLTFQKICTTLGTLSLTIFLAACSGSGGSNSVVISHASYATAAGGAFSDAAEDVTSDQNRNIITVGDFQDTVNFNPAVRDTVASNGGSDIFVIKQSPSGENLWSITIGGTENDIPWSVETDNAGNIFITGQFRDTVDFDPGEGVQLLTSEATISVFILKLGPDGTFKWAINLGSTGTNYGNDLTIDQDQNVYVTGLFLDTVDFDPSEETFELTSAGSFDAFVLKLTSTGEFIWAKQLSSSSSVFGHTIASDSNNNVFISGSFNDTVDLDPGVGIAEHTAADQMDMFLTSLTSNGVYRWSVTAGGDGEDSGRELAVDTDGFINIMGQFTDSIDFSPLRGDTTLDPLGFQGVFIAQYDPNGNLVWVTAADSPEFTEATSITTDPSNNVYAVGAYFANAVIGLGKDATPLPLEGGADAFIACIDQDGGLLWADRFGDTGFEIVSAIEIDLDLSIILAGHFDGPMDLPAPLEGTLTNEGYQDIFTIKFITDTWH